MSFDLSTITTKNSDRGDCTIIHSVGGVGKTTFAANACLDRNGIFLCAEDGLSPLGFEGVARVPGIIDNWTKFQEIISTLAIKEHDYKLIVIDTIDKLNVAFDKFVVDKYYDGDEIKAEAFKSKYQQYRQEFSKLLDAFYLIQKKGIEIIVLAHSVINSYRAPDTETYQRWSLGLLGGGKTNLSTMLYDYADNCLFAKMDVKVVDGKAFGETRVLCTRWNPAYDSKTRHSVPEKIAFDWGAYCKAIAKSKKES